jgi:hypothetical protein
MERVMRVMFDEKYAVAAAELEAIWLAQPDKDKNKGSGNGNDKDKGQANWNKFVRERI